MEVKRTRKKTKKKETWASYLKLRFFVLLVFLPHSYAEEHIKAIEKGTLFVTLGEVQVSNSFAHLHIPFDLDDLIARVTYLEAINERVKILEVPKDLTGEDQDNVARRLKFMQDFVEHAVQGVRAQVNEVLESFQTLATQNERPKRFVGVLAAVIAGAVAGGMTASFTEDTMTSVVENSQNVISQTVEDNLVRLAQDHQDIENLNQTVILLEKDFEASFVGRHRLDFEHALLRSTLIVSIMEREIRTLVRIVQEAKLGKLDVESVNPQQLHQSLAKLNEEAVSHGFETVVKDVITVRKLSTTTAFEPATNRVHVITHIPLVRPGSDMTLLKFINIPQETNLTDANGEPVFAEIHPAQRYLAVSKDATSYFVMDEDDMASCHRFVSSEESYFCPSQSRLKKTYSTCLFSLYQGNAEEVKKLCQQTLGNEISQASRLDNSHWMIFESTPQDLIIACPDQPTFREKIDAPVMVNLQPGCQLNTDSRTIIRPNFESEVTMKDYYHQPMPSTSPSEWITEGTEPHVNQAIKELIKKSGQKISVETIDTLAKFRKSLAEIKTHSFSFSGFHFPHWLINSFVPSIASIAIIGVTLYILMKCGPKITKCSPCKTKTTPTRGESHQRLAGGNSGTLTTTFSRDPENVELRDFSRNTSTDRLSSQFPTLQQLWDQVVFLQETGASQQNQLNNQSKIIEEQRNAIQKTSEENQELKKKIIRTKTKMSEQNLASGPLPTPSDGQAVDCVPPLSRCS